MTYSIVAFDGDTGEIGVAVQTRWPAVGATVPWVEPGVGAVATQSFTNVDLGPQGLALLREGKPAPVALRELVAGDAGRNVRQIGLVDATGRSAAHTGSDCVAEAGHVCETDVCVQGNMLERAGAWHAMLDAFRGTSGDLADRLLAALRAGERSGGDIRGCQSAALLVAPGSPGAEPWVRRFDLRIDDAPRPLEELARLLRVARAYEALRAAIAAIAAGDLEIALEATTAAHQLVPEDAQVTYRHAMVLLANGKTSEARPLLEAALRSEPRLAEFGHRFADAGHGAQIAHALRSVSRPTVAQYGARPKGTTGPGPDPG
jgi:uncharacterized Ntn-hydrolase superfamily protein